MKKHFYRIPLTALLLVTLLTCYGQSWHRTNAANFFDDINAVHVFNTQSIALGGGVAGFIQGQAMFSTFTRGLNWSENNTDFQVPCNRSFVFDSHNNGIGVGDSGRIIRSYDGGQSWPDVSATINRNLNHITHVTNSTYIAVGGFAGPGGAQTILRTADAGNTWSVLYDGPGAFLRSAFFKDSLFGIAVGDSGTILSTNNGGANWLPVTPPVIRNFNAITFINADTGFIAGGDDSTSTLLLTVNGGNSWQIVFDTAGGQLKDITFTTPSTGYAIGALATVLKTSNAGVNWQQQYVDSTLSTSVEFRSVSFYNPDFGVIGGSSGYTYIYTGKDVSVATIGVQQIDINTIDFEGAASTMGDSDVMFFMYSVDSNFSNPTGFITLPAAFYSTDTLTFHASMSWFVNHTRYYYFATDGITSGDTLSFVFGDTNTYFKTDLPTNISDTGVVLRGSLANLSGQWSLSFEYGPTLALDSSIAGRPALVSDTLPHAVYCQLQGLTPGVEYYYRLKGISGADTIDGGIKFFKTKLPLTDLETQTALTRDSSVAFRGVISGLTMPAHLYFQFGTTTNMELATFGTNYNDTATLSVWDSWIHLIPGKQYYYRLVAETSDGIFYFGETKTFTTGTTAFQTLLASQVTGSSAQLNGLAVHINNNSAMTFEYGTSPAFGNVITGNPGLVTDTNAHPISANVTGLIPNTLYYYRLVAADTLLGTLYGNTVQFYAADCEIPNCDFEVWDSLIIQAPDNWSTMGEVHKVPSYDGSNAVEFSGGSISHLGAMILGNVKGNNATGCSFTARPDSVQFYARYNIMPGDTGYATFIFLSSGNVISQLNIPITGNTANSFVLKKYKINYTSNAVPDTLSIFFLSGNGYAADPPAASNPNSVLAIDNLLFTGTSQNAPNANFENWHTTVIETPDLWHSNPENQFIAPGNLLPVSKAVFAPSGHFAVKLAYDTAVNGKPPYIRPGAGDIQPGKPTFAVNVRHQTFNGFVKFIPQNHDSLMITVSFYKQGVQIALGTQFIDSAILAYAPFSVGLHYLDTVQTDAPDSADIVIQLGPNGTHGNSVAYIDNLSFDGYHPAGLNNDFKAEALPTCQVYPNPASNQVAVETYGLSGTINYNIYTITGVRVAQYQAVSFQNQLTTVINTSTFTPGTYIINVTAGQTNFSQLINVIR